jgi:hypothetical protein
MSCRPALPTSAAPKACPPTSPSPLPLTLLLTSRLVGCRQASPANAALGLPASSPGLPSLLNPRAFVTVMGPPLGGVLDRTNSTSQPTLEHQGKGEACDTGGAGGRHHVRNTRDKRGSWAACSHQHQPPRPTAHSPRRCVPATESSATAELSNELSNESTEQQED